MAEDTMAQAARRGVGQYVVLGAGLDSFGARAALPGVVTYEVDHPATQAWKRAMLDEAGLAAPESLRFVAVDFERQDLRAELARAGFRFDAPAVFAMLGVAIYVERQALLETWSIPAGMPGGTALVFDYVEDPEGAASEVRDGYAAMAQRVAEAGEPWRTCFRPGELARDLRALGFAEIVDLDSRALTDRLFAGRSDNLRPGPLTHVVVAS
jgi:methyltransferase (TIGR00027 family)